MIKDLQDGMNANGVYLLKNVTKGITTSGLNYLNIILQDKSGIVDGKKWDINAEDLEIFKVGSIVEIEAEAYLYRDKLQVKIFKGKSVDEAKANLTDLLIESPIKIEELIDLLNHYRNSVVNTDCKKITDAIFEKYYDRFINFPAAVSVHHEFYHGLIYHSVSMCRIAESLAKLYPEIDYDILITGCLIHDIGKTIEFSGPVATKYTIEGNLLGHISIGESIVKEISDELKITSEIPMLLEHMILSHHGKLEYGSPILPSTREAYILSMIDELDSKMMIIEKAYNNIQEGEYTDRIFSFDNRSFYKPHKN